MIYSAKGKNGGIIFDIKSYTNDYQFARLELVQRYLVQLYEYTYERMYREYKKLTRRDQYNILTKNNKDRDAQIILDFDTLIYNPAKNVVRGIDYFNGIVLYDNISVYIIPDIIQYRIKERVIWYASSDLYYTLPNFKTWKYETAVTPNSLSNKVHIFLNSKESNYPSRRFRPDDPFIPQIVRPSIINEFIHDVELSANMLDEFTDRMVFEPSDFGKYTVPVLGSVLSASSKYEVDRLRQYIKEHGYKVRHSNLRIRKDLSGKYYGIINFHLVRDDKDDVKKLMFTDAGLQAMDKIYIRRKEREYDEFDRTIPGYYG